MTVKIIDKTPSAYGYPLLGKPLPSAFSAFP